MNNIYYKEAPFPYAIKILGWMGYLWITIAASEIHVGPINLL